MHFKNKVILVTGSTRGIGLEIATFFAARGANLIVHGPAVSTELDNALERISQHSSTSVKLACDLVDSMAIRKMFQKINSLFWATIEITPMTPRIGNTYLAVTSSAGPGSSIGDRKTGAWSATRFTNLDDLELS